MEKQEQKFFSLEERARILFHENGEARINLWKSLVKESNLNKKNKDRFDEIFDVPFHPIKHGGIASYLDSIKAELWDACVYSYQTDEALAIYKNVETDIVEFKKELYSG